MKYELMVFENHEVEIVEINGKVLFNPYHVGECLSIDSVTVRRHIQSMNEKQVIKLTNQMLKNSNVQNMNFRKLHNTGENFLTESGVYKLVFKSHKENAERFQDWVTDEVLPSLRQTGTYTMPQTDQQKQSVTATEYLEITKSIADWLKVNDASKIAMLKTALSNYNLPTNILPVYTQSKGELLSCTACLKHIGAKITANAFNLLLIKHGYLEEKERPSIHTKSGTKKYKMLTEKGLEFGENQVCPSNPRETQPLYYVDKFQKLFDIVYY